MTTDLSQQQWNKLEDDAVLRDIMADEWIQCWKCSGEGYSGHDCGDDTCCCYTPEDNVQCDICGGLGGWKNIPKQTEPNS